MGGVIFLILILVVGVMSIILGIASNTKEKRKEEERTLRLSNLKVGDEFIEMHWRKNSFKILEISHTRVFVKIQRNSGKEEILPIDKFKEESVLLNREESNFTYDLYIKNKS